MPPPLNKDSPIFEFFSKEENMILKNSKGAGRFLNETIK